MKICAFYQTFIKIPKEVFDKLDRIIISSFHFNIGCCSTYLHLNDNDPYSSKFSEMWDNIYDLYLQNGTEILINLGGAGGGLAEMFMKNYKTNIMYLQDLFNHFFFLKGVVIDAERSVSLENIKMLVNDLNLLNIKVYFAPVYNSMLYPSSPGMGGFPYKIFEDSQDKVNGFFIQTYFNSEFDGESYKEINNNFMNFNTLSFGIMPGTVPLSLISKKIESLENNNCEEIFIWELGEKGAIELINKISSIKKSYLT